MEGHVNVTVLSRSRYEGGEDVLAFAGNGLLKRTERGWHLRYTASSQDGSHMASDVRLEDGRATVRNITGDYTLLLDPRETTQARIPTQLGALTMAVTTRGLDWQLEEAPGRIMMDYTLTALGQTLSDLHLTVYLTYK
ncbi:MAG: DUF1934 domain-containing protein [Ruminococcaceae bacterium]|nr:DUF1934 domain-containing protein [Oscillospiraceae bacterium]